MEPRKPTDEVSAQQEHVTLHGCGGGVPVEGTPPGVSVAHLPRVPKFDHSEVKERVWEPELEGTTAPGVPEDYHPGAQETAGDRVRNSGKEQENKSSYGPAVFIVTIDDSFQQVDTPLHAVSWKDETHPMWVRIRTVMDSGAAESVAPPSLAPKVSIDESPGPREGSTTCLPVRDDSHIWDNKC